MARLFRRLAGRACPPDGNIPLGEAVLVLTDDAGIRRINRRYLGSAASTDVISLRYDPSPEQAGVYHGEVFINIERAVLAGPAYGGVAREIALYAAHGCDHLAGEDDHTTAGMKRMRRRELRWLAESEKLGLLKGLVPRESRGGRSKHRRHAARNSK